MLQKYIGVGSMTF